MSGVVGPSAPFARRSTMPRRVLWSGRHAGLPTAARVEGIPSDLAQGHPTVEGHVGCRRRRRSTAVNNTHSSFNCFRTFFFCFNLYCRYVCRVEQRGQRYSFETSKPPSWNPTKKRLAICISTFIIHMYRTTFIMHAYYHTESIQICVKIRFLCCWYSSVLGFTISSISRTLKNVCGTLLPCYLYSKYVLLSIRLGIATKLMKARVRWLFNSIWVIFCNSVVMYSVKCASVCSTNLLVRMNCYQKWHWTWRFCSLNA